jgi:hypothetical protein
LLLVVEPVALTKAGVAVLVVYWQTQLLLLWVLHTQLL